MTAVPSNKASPAIWFKGQWRQGKREIAWAPEKDGTEGYSELCIALCSDTLIFLWVCDLSAQAKPNETE